MGCVAVAVAVAVVVAAVAVVAVLFVVALFVAGVLLLLLLAAGFDVFVTGVMGGGIVLLTPGTHQHMAPGCQLRCMYAIPCLDACPGACHVHVYVMCMPT